MQINLHSCFSFPFLAHRAALPWLCSFLFISFLSLLRLSLADPQTHQLNWQVQYTSVTRLCHTKSLVSVNGQFPGPTVYVREGDSVVVNVTNLVPYNITIHWHGVRQLLTGWADGPAYITQCPIQTGHSYVHKFEIIDQRGTLFWHAHISWLRATVHGAFIILPKDTVAYPFSEPTTDIPIILGEWWNSDVEQVIAAALKTGGAYNISDAITINGQPGSQYNCSLDATPVFDVTKGNTYLLRIINAAVNFQMFVAVTNHSLTVVEVDAEYTQPLTTNVVVLAPGQTTNVLLTANQAIGQYYITATIYSPASNVLVPFPTTPATAILRYNGASTVASSSLALPSFPDYNDTLYVANFTQSLRGQSYTKGFYYYDIPKTIDENLFFTVGYALQPCSDCSSPFPGDRFAASVNNVSFVTPQISLLQAYYNHITGVYGTDFPSQPLFQYNYTGVNPTDKFSVKATKVKVFNFGANVQIVFQDTATLFFESHPIHLHGQNFYIVGTGFGTFNASSDPAKFNLNNPPSRNTVAVPPGGWAAVRFRTTNPGVWYMHCHFDLHSSWGMSMAFIVKNGVGNQQTLPPPPADQPSC